MSARPFVPTEEQVAIADALALGGNMAINAGAGTGKSSTLHYLVREHIPRSNGVLMCVFNARNKEELAEKLAKQGIQKASAKTFAGMSYAAFWKRYPKSLKAGDAPDTQKYRRLARWWVATHLPPDRTPEMLKEASKMLQDVVTYFMINTTRHHETGKLVLFIGGSLNDPDSVVDHTYEAAHYTALTYGFDLDYSDEEGRTNDDIERMVIEDMQAIMEKGVPDLIHFGRLAFHDPEIAASRLRDGDGKLIQDGLDLGNGWVDFLDMMYWCVVEGWNVWQSQWVLIDEAQDLSPLERALVDMHLVKAGRWSKTPGRLIMVGDPQQAINAFKGADNDGFMNSQIFWNVSPEAVKPLSVCWRCFREIVELAANWKEGFTPAPDAISGIIADIHDSDLIKLVKDGDAIISRLRSATVVWWRKLVKAGIPAKILGQNPAETVIRLLEKVAGFDGFKFSELNQRLDQYQKDHIEKLTKKNRGDAEITAFVDEMDTVRAMIEDVEAKTMDDLIDKIRRDLDPRNMPKNGVSIMTGHGCKGGEWPKVFNVTPDKFPLIYMEQSTGAYIQEKNLQYVVQTRSMEAYFLVSPENKPYDPNKPTNIEIDTMPVLHLGAGSDIEITNEDDEYWEDEADEGLEMTPAMMANAARLMAAEQGHQTITISTPAVLALPAPQTPDADDEEIIELEVSPKGEKPAKPVPPAVLTIEDDESDSETLYDLGAAVYHKGKAGRVTSVQPNVRRVHYVESNNPPYMFPKVEELMIRERSPLPTTPVLLKGIGLGPIDTDMISLDGRTDKGAEHRAFAIGRWLTEMDLWDGFKTRVRIADAYAVHDRPVEDRYITVSMENNELMVRAASAPVVVPTKSLADLRADLAATDGTPEPTPVTPAVMPLPESPFRATGNLARDMQAAKDAAQVKLAKVISNFNLEQTLLMIELLQARAEELEAESKPELA